MRMNNGGFLLLPFMCCACGSLKSTQQFREQISQRETASYGHTDETRQSSHTAFITDSSSAAYEVQIIPVGAFTYDAARGFQGMATKVILKGKQQRNMQQQLAANSLSHLKQANLVKDKKEYRKVEKARVKTSPTVPAWLRVSLFVGCLAGCLYLLRRHR